MIRVNISNQKTKNGFCDITYQVLKTCKLRRYTYIIILFDFEHNAHYSIVHFGWLRHIEAYIDFRYVVNLNIFDWVRTRCWEDDIKLMTLIDLTILLLSGCKNRLRWAFNTKSANCSAAGFLWSFIFLQMGHVPTLVCKVVIKFSKQITNKTLSVAS